MTYQVHVSGTPAPVCFESFSAAEAYRHQVVTQTRRFAWVQVS